MWPTPHVCVPRDTPSGNTVSVCNQTGNLELSRSFRSYESQLPSRGLAVSNQLQF